MENASKALIIAGAILLAILIISLGILIYNQASSVAQKNGMDEVETSSFNQKFTQYEGTVKGSTVRSLVQAVIANNSAAENEERQVKITGSVSTDANDNTKVDTSGIKSANTYTVKCEYTNGLVSSISISGGSTGQP